MKERDITGIMVYYYYVCKRKLWYFLHEIRLEADDQNVKLGKLLDENSYIRDNKHIMIDGVINIDFLRGNSVLHEVKKSKSIEEAGIMQVKYYLYYLNKKGIKDMKAKIDYPLIKESLSVNLEADDFKKLENAIADIVEISNEDDVPMLNKSGICKKCAYHDLCFI